MAPKLAALKLRVEQAKAQAKNEALAVPVELKDDFTADQVSLCRTLFAFFDADGSGSISRDELSAALSRLGHAPTKQRLDEILSEGPPFFFTDIRMILYISRCNVHTCLWHTDTSNAAVRASTN